MWACVRNIPAIVPHVKDNFEISICQNQNQNQKTINWETLGEKIEHPGVRSNNLSWKGGLRRGGKMQAEYQKEPEMASGR